MQRSPISMGDLASSASDGTSYSCKDVAVSSYCVLAGGQPWRKRKESHRYMIIDRST